MVDAAVHTDEDFYLANYPAMVRLAYLTTGSRAAAEDLVQDAFLEWYRRRESIREPAAYLRRAVVSRCVSWVRRRVVERKHRPTFDDAAAGPDADTVAVRAALAGLKPRQRAAVFLRYYLDLPEADIAAALGCRAGTVKSLLHRSLASMREALDER
jgi:RNA polymerase sigma-70 factor (sigma-E family)